MGKAQKTVSQTYIRTLKTIYRKADLICTRHPGTDRETVVQTLLLLKQTPAERLARALSRMRSLHAK